MRSSLLLVTLAGSMGCGRLGFDALDRGDAATGDGSVNCSQSFDFCEDFEGPTIDTTTWTVVGTVARESVIVHRGSGAARASTTSLVPSENRKSVLVQTASLAAGQPSTIWIRAWVRVGALPAVGNSAEIFQAAQATGAGDGNYVFVSGTDVSSYTQFENDSANSLAPAPTNTWFCLVWKVARATSPTGQLELSSDVLATLRLSNVRTDGIPPITELGFGINFATFNVSVAQPMYIAFLDDIIVHSAPVTCAD